ncbi:MAG: hypothetical protein PHT32_08500 [Candidatus Omnitrophica bacterium]|nr:hypothetical protein [Candidatus Omnitrophota bacterium]
MKKILPLFTLLIFFTLMPGSAHAAFTLETDINSIDFGAMAPDEIKGDIPSQGVTVRCTTDQGNAWFLRTRLDTQLTNANNPSSVIPSENFRWYGSSTTGTGQLVMTEQDYLVERIVYTAPAGEGASGVNIKVKFKLNIPHRVQSGTYNSRIIFTMIE